MSLFRKLMAVCVIATLTAAGTMTALVWAFPQTRGPVAEGIEHAGAWVSTVASSAAASLAAHRLIQTKPVAPTVKSQADPFNVSVLKNNDLLGKAKVVAALVDAVFTLIRKGALETDIYQAAAKVVVAQKDLNNAIAEASSLPAPPEPGSAIDLELRSAVAAQMKLPQVAMIIADIRRFAEIGQNELKQLKDANTRLVSELRSARTDVVRLQEAAKTSENERVAIENKIAGLSKTNAALEKRLATPPAPPPPAVSTPQRYPGSSMSLATRVERTSAGVVKFHVSVVNNGEKPLQALTVRFSPCECSTQLSVSPNGETYSNGAVIWRIANVPAGETASTWVSLRLSGRAATFTATAEAEGMADQTQIVKNFDAYQI